MTVTLIVVERGAGPAERHFDDEFYERKQRAGWRPGARVKFGLEIGIEDEWFTVDRMELWREMDGKRIRDPYIRIWQPTVH